MKAALAVFGIVGAVFALAGVCLGFVPLKADGIDCGSAFVGSEYGGNPFLGGSSCDGPRSTMRVPAIVLLVTGGALMAVGGIGAMVVSDERRQDAAMAAGNAYAGSEVVPVHGNTGWDLGCRCRSCVDAKDVTDG